MPGIEIYTMHSYFGEFEVHWKEKVGGHCIIVIKHGMTVFCHKT